MVTRLCLYLGHTLPNCPFNTQPEGCPQPTPTVGALRTGGPPHSCGLRHLPKGPRHLSRALQNGQARLGEPTFPMSLPQSEGAFPSTEEPGGPALDLQRVCSSHHPTGPGAKVTQPHPHQPQSESRCWVWGRREGGQAGLLCEGQRCWHGPGRGSWSHAVLPASRRAEKTLRVAVSCHVCSQKRQTQQEGSFKTHIPALPLDFRCEVPTRPRPHQQAHSQVWAGGRQVGGPVSRAPRGLVHRGVQRTFRGHRWAFHGSPSGLPVLRLGPWKGSGLEEAPREWA